MYFPFEQYIYSTLEKEYIQDIKKKNSVIKYVNALTVDSGDYISLHKLAILMSFFRNTFCKESFIYFFLNKFDEEERELLAPIVFDMFVRSQQGEVGEYHDYYKLIVRLNDDIKESPSDLLDNWIKLKDEMALV